MTVKEAIAIMEKRVEILKNAYQDRDVAALTMLIDIAESYTKMLDGIREDCFKSTSMRASLQDTGILKPCIK